MNTSIRRTALACALLATTATAGLVAAPAAAQTSTSSFPVRQFTDDVGVDLMTGVYSAVSPAVVVGDGETGLSYTRSLRSGLNGDALLGTVSVDGSTYTVSIGTHTEHFTLLSDGSYAPVEQRGSTLTYFASPQTYTYTTADGTVTVYNYANYDYGNADGWAITSITYPSGKKLTFQYEIGQRAVGSFPGGVAYSYGRRLQAVNSNTGYQMSFTYESNDPSVSIGHWMHVKKVTGSNTICGTGCSNPGNPSVEVSSLDTYSSYREFTDSAGGITRYTNTDGKITAVRRPGSSVDNVTLAYHTDGKVSSVTVDGIATSYAYSDLNGIRTVTVTRGSNSRVVKFDLAKSQIVESMDELNRTTLIEYDSSNRPTKVTAPEGNYVTYAYDSRGNITTTTAKAKANSGTPDIVTTASYDTSCTVAVKCNQPNSTTDARGQTTNYTYDTTHGGILTATAPAVGGVSPQTRYTYTRLGSNGSASSTGVFRLTEVSACQTQSSCAGTADEVKTTTVYGNNLNPSSVTVASGSNNVSAAQSMTWDAIGNLLTVDGPISGTADTVRHRYDIRRQRVGTVSPDPDGTGSLAHPAERITYNALGQPTKVESGTVASQSDTDWTGMTVNRTLDIAYDTKARKEKETLSAGGTAYSLVHYGYDAIGRPECVAQRMNPAEYSSLPTSACTADTPHTTFGPDRIGKTSYNAAGEVTQVASLVGSAWETAVAKTYRSNGQVETVTDGENNKTTYEYDGQDRLVKTRFPSPTKGAGTSSTTDYEQLTYETLSSGTRTSGLVTARRTRRGETIDFSHDALGRVTVKAVPERTGLASTHTRDVYYTYDLLGRMRTARFGSTSGVGITYYYNALGRITSVGDSMSGTTRYLSYGYDAAGRPTHIDHPDAQRFHYAYDTLGRLTSVTEPYVSGSNDHFIARYYYNAAGFNNSMVRGAGTAGFSTSFYYDGVGRRTSLHHSLPGTTHDVSLSFNYNPASQLTSQSRNNDVYSWTDHYNIDRDYGANGLNQYTNTVVGTTTTATFTYDANGNLTGDGTNSFVYDVENRLVSVSGARSGTLTYDPLGRLSSVASGTSTTQFVHDGSSLAVEYDGSGTMLRRYVHGAGTDAPVALYEGASTGVANRDYYQPDERGSVMALVNHDGSNRAVKAYDEYGITNNPAPGRFGYTGQAWLDEIGLYYYKARMYSPTLGRFMQTDPIGYGDGMNMYAYVGADPVNKVDPTGMIQVCYTVVKDVSVTVLEGDGTDGSSDGRSNATYSPRFVTECKEVGDGPVGPREPPRPHGPIEPAVDPTVYPLSLAPQPRRCHGPYPTIRVCEADPPPELTREEICRNIKNSMVAAAALTGLGTAQGGAELLGLIRNIPQVRGALMLGGGAAVVFLATAWVANDCGSL